MTSESRSRFWRTVIGFVVGAFLGLSSPTSAVIFGLLGALVGLASTMSASYDRMTRDASVKSFLAKALLSGDLDEETHDRLLRRLSVAERDRRADVTAAPPAPRDVMAPPAPVLPPKPPAPRPPAADRFDLTEPPTAPQPTAPRPRTRTAPPSSSVPGAPRRALIDFGPVARAFAGFWQALRADFGVQGLGSLGVLLVFTATLGFVVFAFSEVGAAFRPVAEVMVPVVLFGMSVFLRRRTAPFMAAALEALAGAVTPIMVFAAFTDGAAFPPDLERAALVGALASSSLALGAVYAWVTRRRASTPLRFLVAPLVWTAFGVVGMAIHEEASAALFALILAAIAATPWLLMGSAGRPLSDAARVMVAPGLVIAYTLLLLFAFAEGWPLWPVVFGGIASVGALEGIRRRVPRIWIAQATVIAVTGVAASVTVGTGWAGATVSIVALAMLERWLIDSGDRVVAGIFGSLAAFGAVAATAAPGPLLTVGLVLMLWGHGRRIVTHPTLHIAPAIVGAVAPAVAAVGLGWLTDAGIGLVATAGVVLATALFVRFVTPSDGYLAVGVLAYGAAVGVAAAITDVVPTDVWVGIGLALAASAVAVVPGRSDVRVWLSGALGVGGWFAYTYSVDLAPHVFGYGLAGAGLALVAAGLVTPGRAGGHLATMGHVIGAGALAVVALEPARIGALALWIAGWLVELVAEPVGSPLQRLVGDRDTVDISWATPVPVLAGLPLLAMAIVAEARPTAELSGVVLVLGAAAVAYGVVAGLPIWRKALSLEAAVAGVVASAGAIALAAGFDPLLGPDRALQATALGAGILGVVASGRRIQPWMHWYAWAVSLPLALLGGLAAGIATNRLHWIAIVWGAVVSTGALIADDAIAGRRTPWTMSTPWLAAPAVLGSFGAVAGIAAGLSVPVGEMWPVALVAAGWTSAMAYLLRSAPITFATWAAAAVTYVSVLYDAGLDPLRQPSLLMWPSLVLLSAAVIIPRTDRYGRFDVPPFAVGLAIGAVAVGSGFPMSATATTWAPIGGALIAVGVVKREWLVVSPIGSVLVIGAAAFGGPWWLTAALGAHAVVAAVLARLQGEATARALQWLSAVLAGGAWASLLWALEMSLGGAVSTTAAMSALIAAAAAILVARNADAHHHGLWSAPFVAVALVGAAMAAAQGVVEEVALGARWVVTAAVLVWLVSSIIAATRLGHDELRLGALAFLGALVAGFGWAMEFGTQGWATSVLVVAVVFTTGASVAIGPIVRHGWREWVIVAIAATHIAGMGLALLLLPDRSLLILALLGAGGASLVADFTFELRGARYFAPGLLFGAWVSFITELSAVDIQWYAPPFALAVIIDLEMMRRRRRREGADPVSSEEMVVIELLAIGLAVGPALAQVVFVGLSYGLLAIVWGSLVAVWGAGTRVRRRVLAGFASAALGALLMVGVPLAELLPEFRGPALWAAVFGIGAVLIAVAATLEQARRRITEVKTSFAAMTEGWE